MHSKKQTKVAPNWLYLKYKNKLPYLKKNKQTNRLDKFQITCNIENCTNCCIEKEKCTDHKCNDDDIIASGDIY